MSCSLNLACGDSERFSIQAPWKRRYMGTHGVGHAKTGAIERCFVRVR